MADFILGRLKFKWQGNWNSSRAYVVDDIVKYGANTYVCVTNHTSGTDDPAFYGDLSAGKWNLHTEGLRFLAAEHTASTFYKLNDVVKFGSQQYRVTTQHESDSTGILDTTKFAVYNEGLQFENSWDASTYYQDGDIVTYGGYSYTALINHSGQTPSGLAPYWEVLTTGFNATGDYNAATAYKTGDTMQFGGWSYVCETDTSAGQARFLSFSSIPGLFRSYCNARRPAPRAMAEYEGCCGTMGEPGSVPAGREFSFSSRRLRDQ